MLKIENLSKTYKNGKKAVDDLSLTVNAGEIFGFIGPNGAGKTTTIKSIVGILEFDAGQIFIDGLSVKTQPLQCKQITAYIPDNPDLYEYLTGLAYINFVADIFGVKKDEREPLLVKYADLLDLKADLANPISSYSHGMKQKLALIAAFIHSPKLLVLDEPFVGLDPKSAHNLKGLMRDLCDKGGAIFFSSHVLDVVEKLCDRIAIIREGKLIACGNTKELKGTAGLEETFLELTDHV
ncbi:MAG: ABC transporter ATP-binding protein [Clostridiales bacterium]|nr:ABC transporter ATP-binding protein [Clostridiales bacterium]